MKIKLIFFFLHLFINPIINLEYCPIKTPSPPEKIKIDTSFKVEPEYKGNKVTPININNRIFTKEAPVMTGTYYSYYSSSDYCPSDFIIPSMETYKSLISELGSKAYSILTDENGFNMKENLYYLTSNKTKTSSFSFYFMFIEDGKIKVEEKESGKIGGGTKINIRCMLSPPSAIKLLYPDYTGNIRYGVSTSIKTDGKYFNGYLWKIGKNKYYTETIKHSFTQSGSFLVEFWGNLITGEIIYLCDEVYVKTKPVDSSQESSLNNKKVIETGFKMQYLSKLHFAHSNSPVAPRINGGYYIAVTDQSKFLHILSFDKDDNLLKDFNTTDLAYPQDITETDYGFVYYAVEADSIYHSYLKLYNKNFELINTVEIMNNNDKDDKTKDSNLKKQIIKYSSNGQPVFGMRFMYRPDNGKIIYSNGIIFLIFCHYNYFLDSGAHTGDTVVTFNDLLRDMYFGETWGASHSLIQSVTFNDDYFFSAALSDAYPKGISVEYTSKKEITNSYDSVNKKYNSRQNSKNTQLAGTITGYENGSADGKLGGIIYFEELGIFCMVYAKTPDPSNGKNIIYATTWTFSNKAFNDIQTKEIKIFEQNNVMQVRAGKYGNDKLFVMYFETTISGGGGYGNVPKGKTPKVYLFKLPSFETVGSISDIEIDGLLMNTNEDLRTFKDGVLIWATSNTNGNLVINKIGKSKLDNTYDDINSIITKKDVEKYDKEHQSFKEEKDDSSLSGAAKFGIAIAVIISILILAFGIFLLWKYIQFKKTGRDFNFTNLKNETLLKY